MKRILFVLLLFVCFIPIWGQTYFSYCKLINGYWGQWENSNPYRFIDGGYLLQGTYDEFIIYENGKHHHDCREGGRDHRHLQRCLRAVHTTALPHAQPHGGTHQRNRLQPPHHRRGGGTARMRAHRPA